MKRRKTSEEMKEPWRTPALIECRLERKPSTLTAIDLSQGNLLNPFNENVMEIRHLQFRKKNPFAKRDQRPWRYRERSLCSYHKILE